MIHLSLDELLAYSQNRVSPEARLRMITHLRQCELCTRELSVVTDSLASEKKENLADIPSDLIRRVLASVQRERTQGTEQRTLPIRVVYDSFTSPIVQGIRGHAQARQILFSSNSYDIDLHVFQASSSKFSLQGQILSKSTQNVEELEGIRVILSSEDSVHRMVLSDNLGRFLFSDLAQSVYVLTVTLPDGHAQFQPLQIG